MRRLSELTYRPAWWVPGPHAQTLWGKLFRRTPRVETRGEEWTTPDGDSLEIRRLDSEDPHAPRILILHGLEGTIRSHYLAGMLAMARQHGWAADVLIFRGCNGKLNSAPRLYHSGETEDLDFVVRQLSAGQASRPLCIVGFSLGGNVLLKWLGEGRSLQSLPLVACAAISVPFDLERGSRHIERGFSRVYSAHFLRTLRVKALRKLAQYPSAFDAGRLERARTLYDFDDAVTAPMHGFRDAHDYYGSSSSLGFLSGINVPTLLLSAEDDPFLPRSVLDDVLKLARKSSNIVVDIVKHGGHVGFVSGTSPLSPHYFAEERVAEFLEGALEDRIAPQSRLAAS